MYPTRKQAKIAGDKYYFTGKFCKNSHISKRQTNNGTCIECNQATSLAHYRRNSSERIGIVKEYQKINKDKVNEWTKTAYLRNKSAYCARVVKRNIEKLRRTPVWLSKKQLKEIKSIYKERDRLSKEKGEVYHVDHIVPLQGKNVSGLHVPWNLRIISAFDNLSKGNTFVAGSQ